MKIRRALIIAAGRGVRFGAATRGLPKPLIEVGGVPILRRILATARKAAIDHFTVVTGYQARVLEDFLRQEAGPSVEVHCLGNENWRRPNGLSVLRAKGHLWGPFFLLMADHLFEARVLDRLCAAPLPPAHCRLAVDFHPERVFDLEDATKVRVRDGRVTDIGKEIRNYSAVDTGIFLCSEAIFSALETSVSQGGESLTDGIRELARQERMEAIDIGDLFWLDIDDETSRLEAERRLAGGRISF